MKKPLDVNSSSQDILLLVVLHIGAKADNIKSQKHQLPKSFKKTCGYI